MDEYFYEVLNKALEFSPFVDLSIENLIYSSHFHEDFELIHVVQGSLELTVDAKTYTMNEGDIGIIMPGEIHSYATLLHNKVYLMKFVEPLNLENINLYSIKFNQNIVTSGSAFYGELLEHVLMIYREFSSKQLGYQFAISSHMLNIILFFVRKIGCYEINNKGKKKIRERMIMLENTNNYIKQNYLNEITLDEIAEHCNYSKYYYSHYFKETTAQSFGEYLVKFRIQKAIEFIESHRYKLTDVAAMSGFSNIRSFNRFFKKYTGMTPTKYKQEYANRSEEKVIYTD